MVRQNIFVTITVFVVFLTVTVTMEENRTQNPEVQRKQSFSNETESFMNMSDNFDEAEFATLNFTRRIQLEEFPSEVLFKYYKNGQLTFISSAAGRESLARTGCSPNEKFAFLLHGWRENADAEWMPTLISMLTKYRGGCIISIDYGSFAAESYLRLFRNFQPLADTITTKLRLLEAQGFSPRRGYIFGFSFGGQLACQIGRNFGKGAFHEIDTCDMAGPGFDYKGSLLVEHRDAAQNVQCIHTTRDKGTRYYKCHQNWRMGNCGYNQVAAEDPPLGSHGLCTRFYTSAFENDFYAVEPPRQCKSRNVASSWPQNFKMGYMERRKSQVSGELFSLTGASFPYTVPLENYDGSSYPSYPSSPSSPTSYSSPSSSGSYGPPFLKSGGRFLKSIREMRKLFRLRPKDLRRT